MKKQTKRKVINISAGIAISSVAVVPISISLVDSINKMKLNNSGAKVESPSKFINENTTIDFSEGKSISPYTSDVFISIPKGFVSVSGGGNLIFAFDKSGNILWEIPNNNDKGKAVRAIEYNSTHDSLIVVYGSSDQGAFAPTLTVKVFGNVSGANRQTPPSQTFFHYEAAPLERYYNNSWGLSPVFNPDSSVSEYIIYSKYYKGPKLGIRSFDAVFSLKIDNQNSISITKTPLAFPEVGNNAFGAAHIYSMASFSYSNSKYNIVSYVYVDDYDTQYGYQPIYFALYQDGVFVQNLNIGLTSNIFNYRYQSDNLYRGKLADIAPSSVGYVFNKRKNWLSVFFLNTFKGEDGGQFKNFNDAYLFNIVVDLSNQNNLRMLENEYIIYPFWDERNDLNQSINANRIVKFGRFDNAVVENKGFRDNVSSLLVAGYKWSLQNSRKKIIALIKLNELRIERYLGEKLVKDLIIDDTTTDSNWMKLFRMGVNVDSTQPLKDTYTDPNWSWDNNEAYGLSQNFRFGLAAIEYNNQENNPFGKNVVYTKQGMPTFSIFDSLPDYSNPIVKYGYRTGVKNDISPTNPLEWGENSVRVDKVIPEYLSNHLKISEGVTGDYLKNITFMDFVKSAQLRIKDISIVSSKGNGIKDILVVPLYASFIYDSNGRIVKEDPTNFANLDTNNLQKHKITTLYIKGFSPIFEGLEKEIVVNDQILSAFVASNPLEGNTKYINVKSESESKLEADIFDIPENKIPVIDNGKEIPLPKIIVEYKIGSQTDGGTWHKKDDFIKYLKENKVDFETNEIWYRLNVQSQIKPETGNRYYFIDGIPRKLYDQDISDNAKVKIYVHDNFEGQSYETLAENVSVSGSSKNVVYDYKKLPIDPNSGQWNGSNGLEIQWTIDRSAMYTDPLITNSWKKEQIKEIDAEDRYLAIRIVAKPGYVYEASYQTPENTPYAIKHDVNTEGIRSDIKVSLEVLQKNLILTGYSNDINLFDLIQKENNVKELNKPYTSHYEKLEIKYRVYLGSKLLNIDWFDSKQLVDFLKKYSTEYTNDTRGIINLVNNESDDVRGIRIFATYFSTDERFSPIDVNHPNFDTNVGVKPDTSQVKTKLDITKWINEMKTTPVGLGPNSETTNITGIYPQGMEKFTPERDGFLYGLTYDQIDKILSEEVGISIEFKAPGSETTKDNWVHKDDILNLNNKNELFVRINVKEKWKTKIEIVVNGSDPQDNFMPTEFQLIVKLPITLNVNPFLLDQLSFVGNTKNIENYSSILSKEQNVISQTKKNNETENENTNNLIQSANIDVLYSLGKLEINTNPSSDKGENEVWMTLEKINEVLSSSRVNFATNVVYAKFIVVNTENSDTKFQLSPNDSIREINSNELSHFSPFKIYINNNLDSTNEAWIKENLKVVGAHDAYEITNYNEWLNKIPQGLSVQYNTSVNSETGEPNEQGWKDNFGEPISTLRKYWIRFKVNPGYVFEGQIKIDEQTYVSNYIELDTSQLKVTLKFESKWLESIKLTGNTKKLKIEEAESIKKATESGQLPIENIVYIEYSVDGNVWMQQKEFEAYLETLDGSLNDTNWIIKREDIKARWSLNYEINNGQPEEPFVFMVDNKIIEDNNSLDNTRVQIISDVLNADVKGYINIDKFKPFVNSNFQVKGTNTNATLYTLNTSEFNKMLTPYASQGIFDILYTSDKNNFFDPSHKVWLPEVGIQPMLKLEGNFSERYFAIAFKVNSDHYELYEQNVMIDSKEKILNEISVYISVEIENPLIGKETKITFLDRENNPIYYQYKGSFEFLISNEQLGYVDFNDFLKSLQLPDDQKNALELVYFVSRNKLIGSEYEEAIEKIKEYDNSNESKYGVWKSLPYTTSTTELLNLELEVGDHVIVALRIKESHIPENNPENGGYVIKEGKYNPTESTRAFGFKIKADEIQVDWESMKLRNKDKADFISYGLDGYAMLNSIKLQKSQNNEHLFVDLSLNYFNDFYVDVDNNVLVSSSDERLVKRQGTDKGYVFLEYYKDKMGNEITDSAGDKIPKYVDTDGILSPPIEFMLPTRQTKLISIGENTFSLSEEAQISSSKHSFFRGQKIEIQFLDKQGLAPEGFNDFYVDQDIKRSYVFDHNQIKFQIPNEGNIHYKFNSSEFVEFINEQSNINNGYVYVNPIDPSKKPTNGSATLVHNFSVTKIQNDQEYKLETIDSIKNDIDQNFGNKIDLKVTYTPVGSEPQIITVEAMFLIKTLRNGDIFKVEFAATNDKDYIFIEQSSPLVFTISGLYEQPIGPEKLQFLRIQQNGELDGEGTFSIFVNDPKYGDLNQDLETQLDGYKFLVQVWDKNREIKHEWTSKLNLINDLSNGDKVAWRLVAENESPLEESFYNTVANIGKHDVINKNYSFSIVNQTGFANTNVSDPQEGIGKDPVDINVYPEDSGFTISGLKEKTDDKFTTITSDEFERVMKLMDFEYTGINGKGDMVSDQDVSQVVVSTLNPTTKQQFTLKDLLDKGYINFYSNNSTSSNLNNFDWNQVKDSSGNWLTSPGNLSNGDTVTIHYQDETMASPYIFEAPVVSGLENKSDEMSMIAWVGVGAASIATLGIFAIIYFIARNKKLK